MKFRRLSDKTQTRIQKAVEHFLNGSPVEESSVILDGPGIGCTSHLLALGYLGMERFLKLKKVHSFSSSSYGTLFFLAKHFDELTLRSEESQGWNRRNQQRHNTSVPFLVLGKIPRLLKSGSLFSNERALEALSCTVSPAFVGRTVKTLPPNVHFWVYNKSENRLESICAENPTFSHWTLGEVVRAAVSIPYIYQEFEKDGKIYKDPMFAPQIRETMRMLRSEQNVLFWNMKYSSEKKGLTAVKGHDSKNGLRRIIVDEIFFLMGIDNPEFDDGIRKGLFETNPVASTIGA
jgi:hypothetical protein